MSAQAIYRRWRPQTFDDVYGQSHITRTLKNAVRTKRLAHAYLFTGLRGTGKTSVARILAKAVNCTGAEEQGVDAPCNTCDLCVSITSGRSLDLIEIDAASNTGVDDVRELREKIGFSPTEAEYKVYIVDEVHMLSTAAFNALLKTLEEPPPHAIFILATTEAHKLPDTIISRCQRHDFRRVPVSDVAGKLAQIAAEEGIEAEPAALERIARAGTGSVRDAESLLDQVLALGEAVTVQRVADALGTPADDAVSAIADALVARDASAGLRGIADAMDQGAEAHLLRRRLLEHLRAMLLIQTGLSRERLDVADEQLEDLRRQAAALPTASLVAAIRRFEAAKASADSGLPSLPLELALVEALLDVGGQVATAQTENAAAAAPAKSKAPEVDPAPVDVATPAEKKAPADKAPTESSAPVEEKAVASAEDGPTGSEADEQADGQPDGQSGDQADGQTEDEADVSAAVETDAGASDQPEAQADTQTDSQTEDAAEPSGDQETGGEDPGAAEVAPQPEDVAQEPNIAPTSDPLPPASIEELRTAWADIVKDVATRDRNVAALLKDCRPMALDGNTATLGFFYEFHAKRAGEAPRRTHITDAISDALGSPHEIRVTVVEASKAEAESRPKSKTDKAKTDPVVRHAIDQLGGRVAGVTGREDDEGDGDEEAGG